MLPYFLASYRAIHARLGKERRYPGWTFAREVVVSGFDDSSVFTTQAVRHWQILLCLVEERARGKEREIYSYHVSIGTSRKHRDKKNRRLLKVRKWRE